MSKFSWNPYDKFKQDLDELPIKEPPCTQCKHWKPIRNYFEWGAFKGLTLCHSENMEHDFSCFRDRPEQSQADNGGRGE